MKKDFDSYVSQKQSEKERYQEIFKLIYDLMTKENLIISQNTALVDKRRRLGKTSKIVQVVLDTEIPPELTIPPKIIQLPD